MRFSRTLLLLTSILVPAALNSQEGSTARAQEFLRSLSGEWVAQNQFGDTLAGFAGVRSYRLLPDSLRLVWEEVIGDSTDTGHGLLWYDAELERFFFFGLYAGQGPILLDGSPDHQWKSITFNPTRPLGSVFRVNRELVISVLRLTGKDEHTWSRTGGGWVVVFRRGSSSAGSLGSSVSVAGRHRGLGGGV